MMLDYNNIKGYDKLSDTAKRVFKRVHKAHNLAQGNEYKNEQNRNNLIEEVEAKPTLWDRLKESFKQK